MDQIDSDERRAEPSDTSTMSRADQVARAFSAFMMVTLLVAAVVLTIIAER